MPAERVGAQHLRDLRSQAVEAIAHADRPARQIHFGPRRQLDHAVAFSTAKTRRSARSLTNASTRSRVPSVRSISIRPGRACMVVFGGGMQADAAGLPAAGPVTRAGPSSAARPNTPSGTNSSGPSAAIAVLDTGAAMAARADTGECARGAADRRQR